MLRVRERNRLSAVCAKCVMVIIRRAVIALLLAATLGAAPHHAAASTEGGDRRGSAWSGLYKLNRMLTFYLVNDANESFTATIRWQNSNQVSMDTPVLIRVLDPNEQQVARHLSPGLKVTGTPGWTQIDLPITASGAGVYQVIVTGFSGMVHFDVSPSISWGVYGYPHLSGTSHLSEAYVYLPPGMTSLNVSTQGTVSYLRLTDENQITHLNISGTNASGYCALPAGEDRIWKLTSSAPSEFGVTFGVAPIIACPDEQTALAIRASVDVLDDGTICYHKFQVDAHQLLQQYAAMNPSSFAVTPPNLTVETPHWISDPTRNQLLLGWYGVYAALPAVLAEQNLDPASPWFGSIRAWHSAGVEKPNPWNKYDRLGMHDPSPGMNVLAAVHDIDDPINPLRHNANLRNRIIVAALRQTMMLREHELPESIHISYDGGEKAVNFANMLRGFPWVVQQCPGDVQAVWTTAMRRYVDHMTIAHVPEIVNQWGFIMMGLQSFAKATGEQAYRDAVDMHINWLLGRRQWGHGAMQAGYFSEGEGPDASYAGINMHMLAWLAEDAQHDALKQAVIRSFTLFNHTIAPEPGGASALWLGSTSFNHRTPWDWVNRQWTAGVGMLADDSPDAAALLGRSWMPARPPRNQAELAAQQQSLQWLLNYHPEDVYDNPQIGPAINNGPMIAMTVYEHYMGTPLNGQLPMKASNRFTRKFGSEFMAVRRPSYYTFIYTGLRFNDWRQPSAPTSPDVQYPRNGGGLSMLWSPKLGTSVLAKNWSAYSTNSVIAKNGPNIFFEDYWQTTSSLQESQSRAVINGKLTDGKMTFRRTLTFLEDRIRCDIRLQPQGSVNYGRLWECFPYPLDKPDPLSVSLYDAQGRKINGNNKVAWAIAFHNSANEVHVIAFNEPRRCEFDTHTSTDAYNQQKEHGRVLTQLPSEFNAGQVRTVKWAARAVHPNQLQNAIKQMVNSLK